MVVRILLFPGFSQNATVFHKKIAAIQKNCGKAVEFVFLEPPHILKAADLAGFGVSSYDSTASFDSPDLLPRAWWLANEDRTVYYGHLESIIYLRDFLAKQTTPFDGVLGFSQGACMAALAVALLERPRLHTDFMINGETPHQPLKFGVYVSGFLPLDANINALFQDGKLKTPSLHVLGRNDVIVGVKRAQTLVDACENPRVEWHDGGHFVPSKASWRHFFKAYLTSFDSESKTLSTSVPSPSSASTDTSAAPSASVTPVVTRPNTPPVSGDPGTKL